MRRVEVDDPPIDPAIERFVELYFENYRRVRDQDPDVGWDEATDASFEIELLAMRDPNAAWPIVLRLIARAPDEDHLAFVAAGPLEDLIRYHGLVVVDRIQARARQDPWFVGALGGVWGWQDVPERVSAALLPFLLPNRKPQCRATWASSSHRNRLARSVDAVAPKNRYEHMSYPRRRVPLQP